MAEFNLQKMKKQFEEVNNMLDKLVGGNTATSLFAVDTANLTDRNCTTLCQDIKRSVALIQWETFIHVKVSIIKNSFLAISWSRI